MKGLIEMTKKSMKNDIRELIRLGVKEVDSKVATAYLMEALSKMFFYDMFGVEVGEDDPYETPKSSDN